MRWVEQRSYVGPDRRQTSRFRLFNRRKKDLSVALPAIQVMLRQLHLRVLDLSTAREAIDSFHLRVQVASQASQDRGETESARLLADVERKVEAKVQSEDSLTHRETDEIQELVSEALSALR